MIPPPPKCRSRTAVLLPNRPQIPGKGRIIQDGATEQTVVFTGQCLRYGIRDGIYKQDVAVRAPDRRAYAVRSFFMHFASILGCAIGAGTTWHSVWGRNRLWLNTPICTSCKRPSNSRPGRKESLAGRCDQMIVRIPCSILYGSLLGALQERTLFLRWQSCRNSHQTKSGFT